LKETDLGKPIIDYLESLHWDVYQEVPCGSGVADIVAVLDEKMWVVELKKSLSLQLLDQAIYRCVRVHYVSIGIPSRNLDAKNYAVKTILDHYGIGVFMVGASGRLSEERKPRLNEDRLLSYDLEKTFKALHPKMKQNKAGSLPGNNWTPWKEWKKNVERVVTENPGITPKEMVEKLKTLAPYTKPKNAEQAAVYYARNGLIERVQVAKENNRLRLYPREAIETRSKGMWG
jgi:hypothetical protein